jgi:hypothetical protein
VSLRELFWPLLGNWTGIEQLADAGTARAMITFKLDVADRVVLQDYRQVRENGAELSGHGVFQVDPVTDELLWWFFDSSGTPPIPLRGAWTDGQLVLGPNSEHRFWISDDDQLNRRSPRLFGSYRRISGH